MNVLYQTMWGVLFKGACEDQFTCCLWSTTQPVKTDLKCPLWFWRSFKKPDKNNSDVVIRVISTWAKSHYFFEESLCNKLGT